jgi:glycosyltransferase involved in cell wall biosynthesis
MTLLLLICAAVPALLFCYNLLLYKEPPQVANEASTSISVLIPARNEELSISAAVSSVLASTGVGFELIVLDDASTDSTAQIVQLFAKKDSRVRLAVAPPLPSGWNGKQHACSVLAGMAHYQTLCFLDADVRVTPLALARMAAFLTESRAALASGFPRQQTVTWLEKLLLPLIHFILLGFLPLSGMRRYPLSASFAAGCGQFLMMRRDAYQVTGGHRAIRTTMHDGLLLPRLFREHGFPTDIADLTHLATCRMYRSAIEVWRGLSKNATEGLAAPARIFPFTLLLVCGQVLPFALLPLASGPTERALLFAAACAAWLPRFLAAARFRQSWLSALFHPFGILALLLLQWTALARKMAGRKSAWKDRVYDGG